LGATPFPSTFSRLGAQPVVTGSASPLLRENHQVVSLKRVAELAMGFVRVFIGVNRLPVWPPFLRANAPRKLSAASSATSVVPTGLAVSVLRREFMTPNAMRLSRIDRNGTGAANRVLAGRHWFQMGRIHAVANVTEMVKVQPLSNKPNLPFKTQSVGPQDFLADPELPVAAAGSGTKPEPAPICLMNVFPKALLDGCGGVAGRPISADAPVVELTKPLLPSRVPAVFDVAGILVHFGPPHLSLRSDSITQTLQV